MSLQIALKAPMKTCFNGKVAGQSKKTYYCETTK